ncbi:MAG TPA: hypothetical protein VGD68_09445 [Streptosporangiaceae bacterium]
MVDAWMPGARCIRAQTDGGTLRGGAPRVVWQALGADPRQISATSAAQHLARDGRPPHLVWNPLSGDIVQLIPVVRAACALGAPEGLDHRTGGGPGAAARETGEPGAVGVGCGAGPANRQGRLCVQVGVVARASEPFTSGPMRGVEALLGWLASWGVPSRWPAGRPGLFMLARTEERSRAQWAMGGHFGASQVPGWDAAGPGHIDTNLLRTPAVVPCPVVSAPRPTLTATPEAPGRTRRMALQAMLGPAHDGAAVASLAPY